MRLFNVRYQDKLESYKIELVADILKMPDSELPAEVWTEAQEILDDEIGTIWRDYINDSLSGRADIQYIEA